MTNMTNPINVDGEIEHLYIRTVRVAHLALDAIERSYAPPPPPLPPVTDDPVALSECRRLSDCFALWAFCERATCFRAGRCCGQRVHCYRYEFDRVPLDAQRGLVVWLQSLKRANRSRKFTDEDKRHITALIAWRRRLGVPDLPSVSSLAARAQRG